MKTILKMTLATFLGLIYLWFLLSFAWSLDEMSVTEKLIGIIYSVLIIPVYEGIKAFGRRIVG